ncbi:MAG: hypothetical protein C0459_02420 [Chitinophaga sp.]|jgi:hypothetical protein|nr:hypothetical protein [Chitinophaga sp.]
MNLKDLEKKIKEIGISSHSYSLDGGLPNEAYSINQNEFQWEVYYSERGRKRGLRIFNDEGLACDYFFHLIAADPTTKK